MLDSGTAKRDDEFFPPPIQGCFCDLLKPMIFAPILPIRESPTISESRAWSSLFVAFSRLDPHQTQAYQAIRVSRVPFRSTWSRLWPSRLV